MIPVPTDINAVVDYRQGPSIVGKGNGRHAGISKLDFEQLRGFALVLVCAVTSLPAWSQVNIGTTLVVGYSKDKVIMAADSRVTHLDGRVEDDQCKIVALGKKLLFGGVGIEGFRSRTPVLHSWEGVAEARQAFANEKVRKSGSVELMSAYWARSINSYLEEQIAHNPEVIVHSIEAYGSVLVYGIFAGKDSNGRLVCLLVMASCDNKLPQFPCTADLIRTNRARLAVQKIDFPVPQTKVKFEAFGVSSTFLKFEDAPQNLSADDLRIWNSIPLRKAIKDPDAQRAVKFVDLTIAYDPLKQGVGGDVDVVELTTCGVKWLNRKQNCPAD